MAADLTALCKRIREADPRIMSLLVADSDGTKLAHSYGPEYEKEYMESAAAIREKTGLFTVVLMGLAQGTEGVFGETEAVVKLHKNVSLVALSTPSKEKVISLVVAKDADVRKLLPKIVPLLKDL